MSNLPTTESQPQPTPVVLTGTAPLNPAPNKSNRNLFLIIGAIIVGFCVCSGACAGLLGTGVITLLTEGDEVEKVVDEFMQAMESKNAEAAYALFSTRSQRQTELADLEKMLAGNNYILFEDYQNVTLQNINISAAVNTDPDMPQGTVAKVNGIITYTGNIEGRFEAVLEQEANQWRLFSINVTVPPDKFNP